MSHSLSLALSGGSRIQRDNKDEAEIASLAETRNCTVYLLSRLSRKRGENVCAKDVHNSFVIRHWEGGGGADDGAFE